MDQGKAESQELMDAVLPLAEQLLTEHGEFFPYGGAMTPTGEIVNVAAYDGDEHPPSTDVISMLNKAFISASRSKTYKATALVYDVRVPLPETGEKSDAIAINLDHQSGYSVVVFLPYEITEQGLKFGSIFAQAGEKGVFK
ncbi:hypothetical protein H5183_08085 [Pseudoalteromonas sp. SR44-8]|uniref:hypothetical protein n=1 Tax=Pseudoalteromonas sp. SR44-8 TaxID=2760933 RepID=UPI0016009A73|nr:hypothetical protein [Pseudoalteromonas sp. SR44-8]MBB1301292.1 hypothetical protein [Pseudoalteromonas sp. SR44-8]